MQTKTISVVGLSREGLSIALALKASPPDFTIVGHDLSPDRLRQADQSGGLDRAESDLSRAAAAADILVLAIPSVEINGTLAAIAGSVQPHTLVLDLSPLKGPGIKAAERHLRQGFYVGARPVLSADRFGEELGGPAAASADLFRNSIFCVMPPANADPQAVDTAVSFGILLGATPYFLDPLEYDALVQAVETVPRLQAAALFGALRQTRGWRDLLRFADLPFALATAPIETDAEEVAHMALADKASTLRWLDALQAELKVLRDRVSAGDAETLQAILDERRDGRILWLKERRENQWVEGEETPLEAPGITEQLFGALGRRGKNKK